MNLFNLFAKGGHIPTPAKPEPKQFCGPKCPNLHTLKELHLQGRVFKAYPIGFEFDYLGVRCKVTGNIAFRKWVQTEKGAGFGHSKITCDYINTVGEITAIEFFCRTIDQWEK